MFTREGNLSARIRKTLIAGAIAACAAALTVGSTSAATPSPSLHQMNVNPVMTPAPASGLTSGVNGNYGLRGCQTQQTAFGACYDPYQFRHAYGIDSLIAGGNDGTSQTIVILAGLHDPYLQGRCGCCDRRAGQ